MCVTFKVKVMQKGSFFIFRVLLTLKTNLFPSDKAQNAQSTVVEGAVYVTPLTELKFAILTTNAPSL